MNERELIQIIRSDILANATGNCQCTNCQRDRQWLKQIDEVLNAYQKLDTRTEVACEGAASAMAQGKLGLVEGQTE